MSAPSGVIFDLDGVLVDSRGPITSCINHALEAHGLARRDPEDLHRFIGPQLATAFEELAGADAVESCLAAYRERYREVSLRETEVFDGMREALAELSRGYSLAVATSKPAAFAEPLLEALGLRDTFSFVAAPDLASRADEKAAMIGEALAALRPAAAVMVGDRSFDVLGAQAHGLATVGVTWGIGSARELRDSGAAAIIDAPAELPAAVRSLL